MLDPETAPRCSTAGFRLNHFPAASGLGHRVIERRPVQDPLVAQARQVERLVAPVQQQLAEAGQLNEKQRAILRKLAQEVEDVPAEVTR